MNMLKAMLLRLKRSKVLQRLGARTPRQLEDSVPKHSSLVDPRPMMKALHSSFDDQKSSGALEQAPLLNLST